MSKRLLVGASALLVLFILSAGPAWAQTEKWSGTFSGGATSSFLCLDGVDSHYEYTGSFSFEIPSSGMAAARQRIQAAEFDGTLTLYETAVEAEGIGCAEPPSVFSSSVQSLPVKVYVGYLGIDIYADSVIMPARFSNRLGTQSLQAMRMHFDPYEEGATIITGTWQGVAGQDAEGNVRASGEFELGSGGELPDECERNECMVEIESDYDGVSADNSSRIRFTFSPSGDYDYLYLDLKTKDGEKLEGKMEWISGTVVDFTPEPAGTLDKGGNYRDYRRPQEAYAVAECTPKMADCETVEPQKRVFRKDFVIVQPPIFFVHGIWSSAATWSEFERRARNDGWQYGDISYSSQDDNKYNAGLLAKELAGFLEGVKSGEYYGNRRISATKADIVSHSMGGVVTRHYIGNMYKGNIRKFIMMGTPNHGSWDTIWIRDILHKLFGGELYITLEQLNPNSQFLLDLNKQKLNPEIDYYTIAGNGWETGDAPGKGETWRGDGVVLVDSVKLPGVPIYCTFSEHASGVSWLVSGYPKAQPDFTRDLDIALTSSEESYKVATDLLLTGKAFRFAVCDKEYMPEKEEVKAMDPKARGYYDQKAVLVRSPVELHAYDGDGNHLGPDGQGGVENTIGEGAFYTADSGAVEGQVINIIGERDTRFVVLGKGTGTFGFSYRESLPDGSVIEEDFENVTVDARTQYVFDPSSETPELVREEAPAAAGGTAFELEGWHMPLLAVLVICFGAYFVIRSGRKK